MDTECVPLKNFSDLFDKFLRKIDQEYVPFVRKVTVVILNDVYQKDKLPALAMEEILWYLAGAFPHQVEDLHPMVKLCQNEIAKLESI